MEFIERTDDGPAPISIARCRELLGEEAESMTDQEIALIRRHAETMASIVVYAYQKECPVSETCERYQACAGDSKSPLQKQVHPGSGSRFRRCRCANALPDPDFK